MPDAHSILFGAVMALLVAGFVLFILCAAEQVANFAGLTLSNQQSEQSDADWGIPLQNRVASFSLP